jgi:sialate O-acetylesterase
MKKTLSVVFNVFICCLISGYADAQLRMPRILCDSMVLQRNQPVPVWGWSKPGQKVTVQFLEKNKSAVADASGLWKVILDPMRASDKPARMIITSKDTTLTIKNILVGEVWLCSGQSNMEYTMKLQPGYKPPVKGEDIQKQELSTAKNPNIRIFLVQKKLSMPDVTTRGWNVARDSALMAFSAVGYFFGKEINKALNVPVGIISSSWGGSRIEPWTPVQAYYSSPVFKNDTAKRPDAIDGSPIGRYYYSMIFPLAPFAVRGFLWYQGESNCMLEEGPRYGEKMKILIDSWRRLWGNNNLPFYFVQLAPYYYTKRNDKLKHTPETLPEFWAVQTKMLRHPNTGMAVITDLADNFSDIHPPYKWEVARRLSLWALAKNYGKKTLEYSGPVYNKMVLKGDKIELEFTHTSGKLVSTDKKLLTWFTIAGKDGVYKPARAVISGINKVIVSNSEVTKPSAVRFGWNETAQPNLFNGAGLPALPFRTTEK